MSTRSRVENFFRARKGQSISVLALVRLAPCRYRQIVSELRDRKMIIRNAKTYTKAGTRSSYTYVGEMK